MAIATLADLHAAVKDDCMRPTDAKFAAALPRFVAAAESRLFDGAGPPLSAEPLRVMAMELTADITATAGAVSLPAGFLEFRLVHWDGSPKSQPAYEPPVIFRSRRYDLTTGSPTRYTIEARQMLLSPAVSGPLHVVYYERPSALVAPTDTNAVLVEHPAAYVAAVLVEAYDYLRNDERRSSALANCTSIVSGLNAAARRGRYGGTTRAPNVPGARV